MEPPHSFIWLIILFDLLLRVAGNSEGDALTAMRNSLSDSNNVLKSWDNQNSFTPCTWFHVTCNPESRVVRVMQISLDNSLDNSLDKSLNFYTCGT
ncbi:unnamed protein product [Thlaspi arvense]|uniref:Leucine-rich repeat-containing N-terminal plant-type domain-containing protein n=1 Tax=Thlaspi arvense TaxID=13288 RepID=A0AAU9RZ30_THLAR|nr:unnamed protein product [Thlaspi arvense]